MVEQDRTSKEKENEGLQPIGQTLLKLQGGPAGKSNGAGRGVETTSAECECKSCAQMFTGEITIYTRFTPPREIKSSECPECKVKREAEEEKARQEKLADELRQMVERWRKTCGVPDHLSAKTFGNFERARQLDAFNDALAWAKGFNIESPKDYPSLIIYSAIPGLGKTHLMVSIANYIFDNWQGTRQWRSPVIFAKGPGLVRRIRATYNLRAEDNTHEREEEVYREVAGAPLLLLDDVGKETPSKFTRETYWYIIDERVTSGLPVIITSRLPLEGDNSLEELMGVDTVDRLYGMTRGEVTEMTGQSYRREKNIP